MLVRDVVPNVQSLDITTIPNTVHCDNVLKRIGFGILAVNAERISSQVCEKTAASAFPMREHGQATLCSEAMSPVEKGQGSTHVL